MHRATFTTMLAVVALSAGMTISRADENYGPLKVQKTNAGVVLADPNGMTLYIYDEDMPGKSTCTGECAEYWPPSKASADAKPAGDLTIIIREDGTRQWADDGKPLYTFAKDKKAGDVMGDNMKGVWHVVKVK